MDKVRYESVAVKNGGILPLTIRVESESAEFLTGIAVDGSGDPIKPKGADMRRHVIQKSEIKSRAELVMNRMYGTLERAERVKS